MTKKLYVRHMDSLGRVVLPAEFRKALGWWENAEVRMELEDGKIILRKGTMQEYSR